MDDGIKWPEFSTETYLRKGVHIFTRMAKNQYKYKQEEVTMTHLVTLKKSQDKKSEGEARLVTNLF